MQAISTILVVVFLVFLCRFTFGLIHPKHKTFTKKFGDDVTRKHITRRYVPLLVALFVAIGIVSPTHAEQGTTPVAASKTSAQSVSAPVVRAPVITTKTETATSPVVYSKQTVNDTALASGTDKVTQVGVNGQKTTTFKVTYTDGKETGRSTLSDVTTLQPVTEITSHGTYVAPVKQAAPATQAPASSVPTQSTTTIPTPSSSSSAAPTDCANGSYVNSAGATVCRPQASDSVPAGATARCVDGTYSFS